MLSDDSSSDSETGRFKCTTETSKEQVKSSKEKESYRSKNRTNTHTKYSSKSDRHQERKTYSPIRSRRYSKDKSSSRSRFVSKERSFGRKSRDRTPIRHRSSNRSHYHSSSKSRDYSKSRKFRSPEAKRSSKEKSKVCIAAKEKSIISSLVRSNTESIESTASKTKKSEVYVPTSKETKTKIAYNPTCEEKNELHLPEEIEPPSYYNMIPSDLKEKSSESSEIDSSDDEKLRAKLLSLEKKVRKRKHKKKFKKRSSRHKEKEELVVEVSSTTDIKENIVVVNSPKTEVVENAEVTSTQISVQKECSEEGEITDDDSLNNIDPTDLRHKLKRSSTKTHSNIGKLQDESKSKIEVCGPALPPHLENRFQRSRSPEVGKNDKTIGPTICPSMRHVLAEAKPQEDTFVISDEDVGIGPLPKGSDDKWSSAHQRLEERALDMKIKLLSGQTLGKNDVKKREEWMLELPEAKAKFLGLEARTFRAKEGPDMSDRSSWTDTPNEKARRMEGLLTEKDVKKNFESDLKAHQIALHDEEQEKAIKKHKKKHKRDESLYDIHQKKLKKKKKKDDKHEKKERKPFSRETDLQVNRFDEAQKRSIIKKAQALDSRFSQGEAKYL